MESLSSANSLTRSPAARALPFDVDAEVAKFTVHPFLRAGLTIAIAAIASQGILQVSATLLVGHAIIHLQKKTKSADFNPSLDSAMKVDAFMVRQYWADIVIPKSLYQGVIAGLPWFVFCMAVAEAPLYIPSLMAYGAISAACFFSLATVESSFRCLVRAKKGLTALQEMIQSVTLPGLATHPPLLNILEEAHKSAMRGEFDSSKFCDLNAFNDKHQLINCPVHLTALFDCYDRNPFMFKENIEKITDDGLKKLLLPYLSISLFKGDPIHYSMIVGLARNYPGIFNPPQIYDYLNEEQITSYQDYMINRIFGRFGRENYDIKDEDWQGFKERLLENEEKDWLWIRFYLNRTSGILNRLTPEKRRSPQGIALWRQREEVLRIYDNPTRFAYPTQGTKVSDEWFDPYFMKETINGLSARFEAIAKIERPLNEFTKEEKRELIQIEMARTLAKYRITKALDPKAKIYPATLRHLLSISEETRHNILKKFPERKSPEKWVQLIIDMDMQQEYFCLNSEGTEVLTTNGVVPGLDLEILEMTLLRLNGAGEEYDPIRKDVQQKLEVLLKSISENATQSQELPHPGTGESND